MNSVGQSTTGRTEEEHTEKRILGNGSQKLPGALAVVHRLGKNTQWRTLEKKGSTGEGVEEQVAAQLREEGGNF